MRHFTGCTAGGTFPPALFPAVLAGALLGGAVLAGTLLAGTLLAGCAGLSSQTAPGPRNGIWEGSGQGWGGEIRVRLHVNSTLIQGIEIVSHNEDPLTGGEAMEELLELVLDYQSADLDAVSGATESSAGFLSAVEEALTRSRSAGPDS